MMLELLAAFVALATPPTFPTPSFPRLARPAAFLSTERSVNNWWLQAALDLDIGIDAALPWATGSVPANLPRCIPLNNYWCIKKAGWAGELGADADGHVAFASAENGAVAAVQLLRRYYLEYGRKSARTIVAHWAPAQCGLSIAAANPPPAAPSPRLQKQARSAARNNSLRTAVANTPAEPPIVLEPPIATETLRLGAASPRSAGAGAASPPPARPALSRDAPLAAQQQPRAVDGCAGETLRLANYAARAAEGISRSPDDDLKLFAADGSPLPSLPRLLTNMSAVEIGPYRADQKLIEAAIQAAPRDRAAPP
jgi:hypothetical protein